MARKDVDLVIRAKDEAAKVVDSITAAINEFIEAQDGLHKSAGKTSSTLGALGTALGTLDKELRGLAVSDKLAGELDKATAAAGRLKAEFEETQASARDLARDLQRAEYATDRLKAKAEGASAAQAKHAAALDKQKKAQAELTAALAKATAERDKLVQQEARLNASGEKQAARVAEITQRYNKLQAEIAATTNPTKTLQNRLESVSSSLEKQKGKLNELGARYTATQQEIEKANASIAEMSGRLETANGVVARQERVVAKIGENYRELEAAAKSAARNQREIADASDKATDTLARQSSRIERAETELTQLAAAAGKADAALAELAGRSGAALQASFDRQRRTMLEAKREWIELTQAAGKLGAEISRVGVPTREMSEAFIRNRAEAARAKQEYLAQRDSLHQLSGVLRQTGGDLDSLRNKQQQFAQIQAQTGTAIARVRQQAQASAGSYNLLSGNANRAGVAIREVANASRTAATGTAQAARETNRLSDAYRRLYGESRQALSWTQRLRGEVLALVSAYGGIYGVISLLRQTVDAYQTLEAAQSRLNVAFEGNKGQVGQELDFIRRNADRLGIEFGSLANEYSKFTIATQGTSLEGEKTRRIFISVAEAARVNKSTFDELRGVFTALTQIVSKGAVQMEELRQQLGDRLPGALSIMAAGLNVTTGELIKMMEAGEVTEEALIPFAEELDRRFGPGLADALKTTTTALGQFRNAAFQALVSFGQAGFIESFTDLINTLTETLKSAEFQSFAARMSQAFSVLIDAIGLAVQNFDLLVIAASAFAGIKLAPLVIALASQFGVLHNRLSRVGSILIATRNVMATTTATATGMAAATGVAATAIRGLTLAVRALVSSTGIGLAITAISVAIGWWATRADEATAALNAHQRIVDAVKNAYDEAGGSVDDWAEKLRGVTLLQARANLTQVVQAAQEAREALKGLSVGTGVANLTGYARQQAEAMRDLAKEFIETGGDVDVFKKKIEALADDRDDDSIKEYALSLLDMADKLRATELSVEQARDVIIALTGSVEEKEAALKRLNGVLDDFEAAMGAASRKAAEFRDALAKINEIVPEIGKNLEEMKMKAELDAAFDSAARAAQTMSQLSGAVDAYNESLNRLYQSQVDKDFGKFTDGMDASAAFIRDREKFRSEAYADMTYRNGAYVNSGYRAGFGSDTITLADGSIHKITQGMRVSVADANRDLYRRIGEFQSGIKDAIGADRFAQFNAQQQAALTSIAYNYGSLPERIIAAVKTGTDAEIAEAIRGLGGDNSGINRERRGMEAALFTSTAGVDAAVAEERAAAKELADEATRRAEEAAKFHEQQIATSEQMQFELSLQDQELVKREQAKAIREAELAAQQAGTELTEKERQAILANVEAKFRQQQIEEQNNATKERAAAAEERVNQLLTQRTELENQLAIYREQGDAEKVAQTEAALTAVNQQLLEAIANAQAMWQAVGGGAADAAIAKLQTARLEAANFGQQARTSYIDWSRVGQLFASGLTNAFDKFAQAVANGEDVGEAAKQAFLEFAADFLRQIAQMIIQQAILNALRAFGLGGVGVGVGHTGGVVGSSRVGSGNATRSVDPMLFANAIRLHEGGIPGLRPGEVPTILKRREEVLTEDDPRHILNGGGVAAPEGGDVTLRNVNVFNAEEMLERALRTRVGERVFLNFVRDNPNAIQAALEGRG